MANKLVFVALVFSLMLFAPIIIHRAPMGGADSAFHYNVGLQFAKSGFSKYYPADPTNFYNYPGKLFAHPRLFYFVEYLFFKANAPAVLMINGLPVILSLILSTVLIYLLTKKIYDGKTAGLASLIFILGVRQSWSIFWGQWLVVFSMPLMLAFFYFWFDYEKSKINLLCCLILLWLIFEAYPPTLFYVLIILATYFLVKAVVLLKKPDVELSLQFDKHDFLVGLGALALALFLAYGLLAKIIRNNLYITGVGNNFFRELIQHYSAMTYDGYIAVWHHPEIIYGPAIILAIAGLLAINNRKLFAIVMGGLLVTNAALISYILGFTIISSRLLVLNNVFMSVLAAGGFYALERISKTKFTKTVVYALLIISLLFLFVLSSRFLLHPPTISKDVFVASEWVQRNSPENSTVCLDLDKSVNKKSNYSAIVSVIAQRRVYSPPNNCTLELTEQSGEVNFGDVWVRKYGP